MDFSGSTGLPRPASPRCANRYRDFVGDGISRRFETFTEPLTNKSAVQ
jgi:hypothetical protein